MDLISQAKGNSQQVWKHINNLLRKDNKRHNRFENKSDNLVTQDESIIAELFNAFFKNSIEELATVFGSREMEIRAPDYDHPVFSFSEVTEQEETNI